MKLISVLVVAATLPLLSPDHATPCDFVAQAMRSSCKLEKRADHKRAVANCRNLSDPDERAACLAQAGRDLHDALEECDAQYAKRLEVCADLGGGVYAPEIDPRNFVRTVDNPYMPLIPGTTLVYEGQTPDGLEHVEFHVLAETREILGVTCTTVHDTSTVGGRLSEDTLDWFAQDVDGNVWYFGENTHTLEGGLIVSLEGTWTAGEDDAHPGIVMKAQPVLGELYRQEFSLGTAEDVARVVSIHETVAVRYGTFADCRKTEDFSALEPEVLENKFFAQGIGSVMEIDLDTGQFIELVDIRHD